MPCDVDLLLLGLFPEQPALTTGLGVVIVAHSRAEDSASSGRSSAPRYWFWGTRGRDILATATEVRKGPAPRKGGSSDGLPLKKVGIGVTYSLALSEDGGLVAWGRDRHGCLGVGSALGGRPKRRCFGPPLPVLFPQGPGTAADPVADIQLGARHVLALTRSGRVFAWGGNQYGQLGVGDDAARCQPALVSLPGDEAAKQVVAVEDGSYALAKRGAVFAWGDNRDGALGLGMPAADSSSSASTAPLANPPKDDPDQILALVRRPQGMRRLSADGGPAVRRLEVQFSFSRGSCGWLPGAIVAYTEPGEAAEGPGSEERLRLDFWMWGLWGWRRLETPVRPHAARSSESPRPADATIVRALVAQRHFHILWDDGVVQTWGRSDHGCLGLGARTVTSCPRTISFPDPGDPVIDLNHGRHHLLALTRAGRIYGWGDNRMGQLGLGNAEQRNEPTLVAELKERRCIQIVAVGDASYALTDEGVVHAWGDNSNGALAALGGGRARALDPVCVGLRGGDVQRLEVMPTPRPALRLVDHSQKRPLGW